MLTKSTDIYLEPAAFKRLCESCHVEVSDQVLETYEKNGLILPLYRVSRPVKYLQALFEQQLDRRRKEPYISVPALYGKLLKFEYSELDRWHSPALPGFEAALKYGHPLDQAFRRGEKFISQPSQGAFKRWDSYKVLLEYPKNGNVCRSQESKTRPFYSPWQVYLLEEANSKYIVEINVLIRLRKGEKYVLSGLPKKLFLTTWQDHFKSLWLYGFRQSLAFVKALSSVEGNILEGAAAKDFRRNSKEIATELYGKYFYSSWIKFLKTLCGLFFRYEEN